MARNSGLGTPITYPRVSLAPGAQLAVAWNPAFSAFAFVLVGNGAVRAEARPIENGGLAVFGPGDHIVITASDEPAGMREVLLLGGLSIRAPIEHYGPFVMNSRAEIL